jgi:UrcA family protein
MKKATSTTSLIACIAIAGAFTAGFLSGPAMADPQDHEPFEFKFSYAASEMSSLDGAQKLVRRLEGDVRDYCGGNRKMTLDEQKLVKTCVSETMQATVARFGNSAVAEAYRTHADG